MGFNNLHYIIIAYSLDVGHVINCSLIKYIEDNNYKLTSLIDNIENLSWYFYSTRFFA